jgi:hypothetical protein
LHQLFVSIDDATLNPDLVWPETPTPPLIIFITIEAPARHPLQITENAFIDGSYAAKGWPRRLRPEFDPKS